MAKAKKTAGIEESAIEAVDFVTEAVTSDEAPVVESIQEAPVIELPVSSAAEVNELWARLEVEVAKLGIIRHLYYVEKAEREIKQLIAQLRSLV